MIEDFFIDLALKNYTYPILFLMLSISVSILLLILFREVRCWYWKVNERLDLQYEEYNAMQEMIELQKKEIKILEDTLIELRYGKNNNPIVTKEVAPTKEETPDTIDS